MVRGSTFEYLAGIVSGKMVELYPKFKTHRYGLRDKIEQRGKVAHLCDLFCRSVCGDDIYILMDEDKRLHAYNGEYYELVGGLDFLVELAKRVLDKLGVGSVYRYFATKLMAKEANSSISHNEQCVFVPDRRYIAFSNGIFDLNDGSLKKFHRRYCTDIVLDIPYNVNASCLTWDIKIKEIIPNKDMLNAFQMFCGTFLVKRDELKIEYICYLIGSGSNGKSVISSAVANVFGEQYFGRFTPYDLFKASDSKVNMAALDGKIGNLTDDLDRQDISGGAFKRFISGEKFQARRLYGNPFLVQAPVMLCCTNTMPESSDDTWGHHRRQLPIMTTRIQYGKDREKDPFLSMKLQTEEARQRIFNWIYEGYKKVMRNNGDIKLPAYVKDIQRELMMDSSSARRWYRDSGYIAVTPDGNDDPRWNTLQHWYNDYVRYAKESGDLDIKTKGDVSKMLADLGCVRKRKSSCMYYCIGIKEEKEDEDEII